MKEIIINVKLKIQDDLDEQDILDHTSAVICQGMHGGGIVEFVDAELAETPGNAGLRTGINIAEIIDGIKNHYEDMRGQSKSMKDEHSALCAINALGTLKTVLERHNLAELVPAAEVDQVRGENLTQSMRLTKAEKLLDEANDWVFVNDSPECAILTKEITEFLYADDPSSKLAVPGISEALVTYDPKSGKETARTALENVLHGVEKAENNSGNLLLTGHEVKDIIAVELKKLEEK